MEPIIKIQNLMVIYDKGTEAEIKALDDISLEISPREFVVIFGPSGCGKSTLLYAAAGIETEISGKIWVAGKNVHELNSMELAAFRRDKIGLVFQAYNLIPTLDVINNVTLPQVFKGAEKTKRINKAKRLLSRFDILSFSKRLPQNLSGGQQQRVAIARALVNEPLIILADEPLGNLDSRSAIEVMRVLKELNEVDGKTIILVTHETLYLKYAEKIIYMKDGKIIKIETQKPEEVKKTESYSKNKPEEAPMEEPTTPSGAASDLSAKTLMSAEALAKKDKTLLLSDECEAKEEIPEELKNLAGLYPYMSAQELKARALTLYLFSEHQGSKEFFRLERKIANLISKFQDQETFNDFCHILDKPLKEGGVGLYFQTAHRISNEIKKILILNQKIYFNRKLANNMGMGEEILQEIYNYSLEDYEGQRTKIQIKDIKELILKRAEKEIDKEKFMDLLETKCGLNWRTSRNIDERLEIILINYFN